jgi:hypothetical protein
MSPLCGRNTEVSGNNLCRLDVFEGSRENLCSFFALERTCMLWNVDGLVADMMFLIPSNRSVDFILDE